jgi:hypothetical protein
MHDAILIQAFTQGNAQWCQTSMAGTHTGTHAGTKKLAIP